MPWIQTLRGHDVDLENPSVEDIDGDELATLLSRLGRWGGHTIEVYTVADHSVEVSLIVEKIARAVYGPCRHQAELTLAALLHDGHEGYLGCDLVKPLKDMLRGVDDVANVWDRVIAARFGIPHELLKSPFVKLADLIMLATEKQLLKPCARDWSLKTPHPLVGEFQGPSRDPQQRFLVRLNYLQKTLGYYSQEKTTITETQNDGSDA